MKAVYFERFGGPDVLTHGERPEPVAGAGEVLVRVRACSINHLDLWVRGGLPGLEPEMPHILGNDVAGEVVAVGAGVTNVVAAEKTLVNPTLSCGTCPACANGDDNLCRSYDVLGRKRNGGYAEFVVVPAANCLPFPTNLSWEQAAAVPLVFLTAWHMLVGRANLKPGETVLVLAAGSGVGIASIQIAKMLGATVIATASTDTKLEHARALGADETINYQTADFAAETRKLTGKRGVDVVIEHTGEATWEKSVASLARGGRLVTCGASSGFDGRTDLRVLFAKNLSIFGSYMGRIGEFATVLEHIRAGRLKPVVDRVLPLAEARAAHEAMEKREQFGKIVLVP